MSQHKVMSAQNVWVFGWDQMLMSFFLQVHDENVSEDENPVLWLSPPGTIMYEVEDLVREAKKHGLEINPEMAMQLYRDKDDGR